MHSDNHTMKVFDGGTGVLCSTAKRGHHTSVEESPPVSQEAHLKNGVLYM